MILSRDLRAWLLYVHTCPYSRVCGYSAGIAFMHKRNSKVQSTTVLNNTVQCPVELYGHVRCIHQDKKKKADPPNSLWMSPADRAFWIFVYMHKCSQCLWYLAVLGEKN